MDLILALLIGGGCVALGSWAIRRKQAEATAAAPSSARQARSLADLLPRDVVSHDGVDWVVSGVASLTEAADHWVEARLSDGGKDAWLVVSSGDPDAALMGQKVGDLVAGDSPSESLEYDGEVYKRECHGAAQVAAVEGDVAAVYAASGDIECGYWLYRRPGAARVWLRRVGDRWSCFAGARVARHLIGFLPGS